MQRTLRRRHSAQLLVPRRIRLGGRFFPSFSGVLEDMMWHQCWGGMRWRQRHDGLDRERMGVWCCTKKQGTLYLIQVII